MRQYPTEFLQQPQQMLVRILSSIVGILLLVSSVSTSVAADRPNIVIILADDLGYGSLNSYGAEGTHIRTPNIDRLAKQGRRFTDANTPSSVPVPMDDALTNSRMPVLQMPNVERLAREGMKFRNAYASPQCSPSRVCVQTAQLSATSLLKML